MACPLSEQFPTLLPCAKFLQDKNTFFSSSCVPHGSLGRPEHSQGNEIKSRWHLFNMDELSDTPLGVFAFGSHQQPSEVLPCIIFYLFTRRKLRHRWLSNLSKFIQTTGSMHPYCSANHSYSYNHWPHGWLLIIWVSQSLVWLHIIFLKLFLTVFMGNSRLKVEKDSQYHQIHPHPKLIKVYSP